MAPLNSFILQYLCLFVYISLSFVLENENDIEKHLIAIFERFTLIYTHYLHKTAS